MFREFRRSMVRRENTRVLFGQYWFGTREVLIRLAQIQYITTKCRRHFSSLPMSLPISERPRHSPTRSLGFYLVLVFCVFPVWSIPILSWSFVLYELRGGGIWGLSWHKALFTYALAEARRPRSQSLPLPDPTSNSRSYSQYTITFSTSLSMALVRFPQEIPRSLF